MRLPGIHLERTRPAWVYWLNSFLKKINEIIKFPPAFSQDALDKLLGFIRQLVRSLQCESKAL